MTSLAKAYCKFCCSFAVLKPLYKHVTLSSLPNTSRTYTKTLPEACHYVTSLHVTTVVCEIVLWSSSLTLFCQPIRTVFLGTSESILVMLTRACSGMKPPSMPFSSVAINHSPIAATSMPSQIDSLRGVECNNAIARPRSSASRHDLTTMYIDGNKVRSVEKVGVCGGRYFTNSSANCTSSRYCGRKWS